MRLNHGTERSNCLTPFRGRSLRTLLFSIVLITTAGLVITCEVASDKRLPEVFPVVWIDSNDLLEIARLTPRGFRPYIHDVSADGRWVYLGWSDFMGDPRGVFFDVEKRRFAGIEKGFEPILCDGWRPDRLMVSRVVETITPAKTPFFEVDAIGRKTRFLFEEVSRSSANRRAWFDNRPCADTSGIEIWNVKPDSTWSKILYSAQRKSVKGGYRTEFVVAEVDSGEKRVQPECSRSARWLPGDRKVGYCSRKTLHFVDTAGQEPTRKIPIHERFESLRKEAALEIGEDTILYKFAGFVAGGRNARFLVTFRPKSKPSDPTAERWSVWDLDVDTGNLVRVMDLPMSAVYSAAIWSPNCTALIAPAPLKLVRAPARAGVPTQVACYREDKPPERLPFKVRKSGVLGRPAGDELMYWHPFLTNTIRFLDEETLVYMPSLNELHRFDLRTGLSELLWRLDGQ